MAGYLARRFLAMLPTIVIVLIVSFFLVRFIPGDPAAVMLGPDASVDQIEQLREAMGLKQAIHVQFLRYIGRVLQGDLGHSILFHRPVAELLVLRAEPTAILAFLSVVVALCIGIPAGVLAAVKRNTFLDQALLVLALAGISVPAFLLGLLIMLVFAVQLHWLPSSGFRSILSSGNIWNIRYLLLPSVTLGFGQAALIARLTRSSMLEVLQEDYVNAARARGVVERGVVLKHALRNASIPIVTVVGFTFAGLLAGAVVTETVFAVGGVGRLVVEAVLARDYPTIQGIMLVVACMYLILNLLTDATYALLDPRIQYS